MMTKKEMLKAAAAAHREWSLRWGDEIPYNPADADPHPGERSDLAIWQADRSAPPEIDDPLNNELKRLIAETRSTP